MGFFNLEFRTVAVLIHVLVFIRPRRKETHLRLLVIKMQLPQISVVKYVVQLQHPWMSQCFNWSFQSGGMPMMVWRKQMTTSFYLQLVLFWKTW